MTSQLTLDYKTGEVITPDDAWHRHRRIVDLRNIAEKTFLALGEELYWFEDLKQYKDLGYETFEQYLADPDVDIARRTAFMLKGVYKTYILELKSASDALLPAGYQKLELMRPYIDESNVNEWVNKAASLSRSDLKEEINNSFPQPPPPPLPPGKYSVIYADPPWEYDNSGFDQSAAKIYPTMDVDRISNLPINEITGPSCVLFLWVTSAFLPEGIEVMDAWGFDYKTSMVWLKNRPPGMGWWVETYCEYLLIGSRGENLHPRDKPINVNVFAEPVTEHSRKPVQVYELIERMYPDEPKIELFARKRREGWSVWGNEDV
jgi:N6-adenosine-specific RNA methylase IME4